MSQRAINYAPGFYLHMQQKGEGCDYTIGCGHKLERLAADDLPMARAMAMDELESHGKENDIRMHLLVVAAVEDLAPVMDADRAARDRLAASNEMAMKRDMLKRLKKELEEDRCACGSGKAFTECHGKAE